MLKWEDRLKLIEESPYYTIPLEDFKVGLKCEYNINWASVEWCFSAEPEVYNVFEVSRLFNIDSDSLEFIPHIVTEDDVKMVHELADYGFVYNGKIVTNFRGLKNLK